MLCPTTWTIWFDIHAFPVMPCIWPIHNQILGLYYAVLIFVEVLGSINASYVLLGLKIFFGLKVFLSCKWDVKFYTWKCSCISGHGILHMHPCVHARMHMHTQLQCKIFLKICSLILCVFLNTFTEHHSVVVGIPASCFGGLV